MQVSSKSPNFVSSRGARFLDLVMQNKLNVSPQLSKARRFSLLTESEKIKNRETEKENKEKDYLKFNSSNPFNPEASPSSSILSKRKAEADSSPLTSSAKVF
jgi:hypothetical protein